MVSYLLLFLVFFFSIGLVSSAETNLPQHLSFENYRSILSFANDEDSKFVGVGELNTNGNGSSEIWDDLLNTDGWNVAERNEKRVKTKTSRAKADLYASHFPFVLCHFGQSSLCGQERHDVIDSLLSKSTDGDSDSSGEYFLNPVPIYNHNNNFQKGKSDVKEDNKNFYATCFHSSIKFSRASQINDKDILVTPVVPMLKLRKHNYHTTEDEQSIDDTTRSLAVILAPGIFSSHEKILEFAYLLQNLQGMNRDSSFFSECDKNIFKATSVSVDSVGMSSYFFLEFHSQVSHQCIRLFMEYVVEHPQVLSIEKVAKTVAFNYEAQWITQSSIPEEKPWFEIGIRGKNQIIQVADTGADLNHCYLKDIDGESVMHTTNWDLTPLEKKIDMTKRKVIQFVRLEGFGDSSDNESGHGTHVVASIVGENLDSNNPLANGVAPDAKICFFDSNVYSSGKSVFVPLIISSLFYFGREAGARIHSASWGSESSSGAYSIKSQQIDEYFYDDFFDSMLMFVAGGNEGQEIGPNKNRICDECGSKNVVCVGASYNNEELRNIVASFSSRGFTEDQRIKPDVLAPGRGVLSARANSGGKCDPDGGRPEFNSNSDGIFDGLVYKSGTSMSCPIAAGSGALVRQYFLDGYYPSGSKKQEDEMDISGTLLKAILINGGEKMEKRSKSFEVESLNNEADFVDSNFYDEYQGFGMVNLLNSLKHPNTELYESPALYVVNEKEIEQGSTHEYKFHSVCDANNFRVTLVWRDPPGTSGCVKCLMNNLDLEVEFGNEIFYPNNKDGPDLRNNIERVILDRFSFSDQATVLVKVTAADLGVGNTQMYSLVSTGCFDNSEVDFDGPDPSPICGPDQFEYTIEVFTNRRPEETSWLFQYQGSGDIITAAIAGQYDELLHLYRETGCAYYNCFLFIIKDTDFNGLCCEKGMGSYLIRDGKEILTERGNSFTDRQQIEKFCHYSDDDFEEPTPSPTTLVCSEDDFKYQIDIETDLYPDETRWLLLRKPCIDSVENGTYTEMYKDYEHEGCLDLGACYWFFISGNPEYNGDYTGEYTIQANDFVVVDRVNFDFSGEKEFCYSGESNFASSHGVRTAVVGGNSGDKFDDVHSLWEYGKIVQIELYGDSYNINFIGITYENGQSFEHGTKIEHGDQHIIILGEDQYIRKISGSADSSIRQIKFETNDGEVFGPYGREYGEPFEFDFGVNVLIYFFGRANRYGITQLGFAHASLSPTTDSPTPYTCGDNQFRYQIKIRTDDEPEGIWWEFYQVFDSISYMTYRNQLGSYSHTGCLTIDENYEFRLFDKRRDGLCCYFGSGSYILSVDNNVVVRGDHFDDAIIVGGYDDPDFVYNKHEFSYTSSVQPTPLPVTCSDDEFEYRIRVRTHIYPGDLWWIFKYSDGTIIEKVDMGEYFLRNSEYNHIGCLPLNECFEYLMPGPRYGSFFGSIGYTILANDVVIVEGEEFDYYYNGIDMFCYGPSYSFSPSSTSSSSPIVCDENQTKYEVIVTIDKAPDRTSWELNYINGTLIDSVGEGNYRDKNNEHVHEGCLDLDSCVIFTIQTSFWSGFKGEYTIMVDDVVMAEGGNFNNQETKTFCFGSSYSFSPSFASNKICETGTNNYEFCGYWSSIGACENSGSEDWMHENCAKACANCCMDYNDRCDDYYYYGRCTDTSEHDYYGTYNLTWQKLMQGDCRYSCDTCDMNFTPLPTTPPMPVTCSDDQFKYEIVVRSGYHHLYYYAFYWTLDYKYEGSADSDYGWYPPYYEKKFYGCARYSCFNLDVYDGYLKMYDDSTGTLIAQNTEKKESLRFCHYAPQPTTLPTISTLPSTTPPLEAIFTITLTFSTSASDKVKHVSEVVERSIQKILFRANIDYESIALYILDYSSCEDFYCDISIQICEGSCDEGEEQDILVFVGNTMNDTLVTDELLSTLKQTGHHMDVDIFNDLIDNNPINIEFNFEFLAWPTTSPTTSPSSATTTTQDCDAPDIVQNLFGFISNIIQPIIQGIADITDPISDVLFGVESYNSSNITCADKMFELQIEIKTDRTPNKTSWELLYENGTTIDSIVQDTYSECDTVHKHTYCLDTSCFVFNMFDSFEFKGSYNITVGNTVLAQQDSFQWWKDTKRFCYPQCEDDGMFALQIELITDNWPQETSWDLVFHNGTFVDHVNKRYYTERNTIYNHRYCLDDGCYDVTFHDHIGDGMCCSYSDGSFKMKISDKVIREGGEFEDSMRKSFCHIPAVTSDEENNSFFFGIFTDLFGDEICCTTDTTGYPTPIPSPYPTTQPSFKPSLLPSSNPSIFLSSNPSLLASSKPSSNPSVLTSSNPSFIPTTTSQPSSNPSSLCNENEFKYEVVVTTDCCPWETFWDLNYTNGILIDIVEEGNYTDDYYEYVYNGCLDLDSCVIFTIFDSYGDGIGGDGGYAILANDVVMAEGGEFNDTETREFCYGPSY